MRTLTPWLGLLFAFILAAVLLSHIGDSLGRTLPSDTDAAVAVIEVVSPVVDSKPRAGLTRTVPEVTKKPNPFHIPGEVKLDGLRSKVVVQVDAVVGHGFSVDAAKRNLSRSVPTKAFRPPTAAPEGDGVVMDAAEAALLRKLDAYPAAYFAHNESGLPRVGSRLEPHRARFDFLYATHPVAVDGVWTAPPPYLNDTVRWDHAYEPLSVLNTTFEVLKTVRHLYNQLSYARKMIDQTTDTRDEVESWTDEELFTSPKFIARDPTNPEAFSRGRYSALHKAIARHHAVCAPVARRYLEMGAYDEPLIVFKPFSAPRVPSSSPTHTRVYILPLPGGAKISAPPPPPPPPAPLKVPFGQTIATAHAEDFTYRSRAWTTSPVGNSTRLDPRNGQIYARFVHPSHPRGRGMRGFRRNASNADAAKWATREGLRLLEDSAEVRGSVAGAGGGARFGLLIESADMYNRSTCVDGDHYAVEIMSHDGTVRYSTEVESLGLGLYFVPVRIMEPGEFAVSVSLLHDRFSVFQPRPPSGPERATSFSWDLVHMHTGSCLAAMPDPSRISNKQWFLKTSKNLTIDNTTLWWNWPATAAFLDHIPQHMVSYVADIRFPSHVVTALLHVSFNDPQPRVPPICGAEVFAKRFDVGTRFVRLEDRHCTPQVCEGYLHVPPLCAVWSHTHEGCAAGWVAAPPDCKFRLYSHLEAWNLLDGVWMSAYGDSTVNEPFLQLTNFLYGRTEGVKEKYPRVSDTFFVRPAVDVLPRIERAVMTTEEVGNEPMTFPLPVGMVNAWRVRSPAYSLGWKLPDGPWSPRLMGSRGGWLNDAFHSVISLALARNRTVDFIGFPLAVPRTRTLKLLCDVDVQDPLEASFHAAKPRHDKGMDAAEQTPESDARVVDGSTIGGFRISTRFSGHYNMSKNYVGFDSVRVKRGQSMLRSLTAPVVHSTVLNPKHETSCEVVTPLSRPFARPVPDFALAGSTLHDLFYTPFRPIFNWKGRGRYMHWGQQLLRMNTSFRVAAESMAETLCRKVSKVEVRNVSSAESVVRPISKAPVVRKSRDVERFRVHCDGDPKGFKRSIFGLRTTVFAGAGDPHYFPRGGGACRSEGGYRSRMFDALLEYHFRRALEGPHSCECDSLKSKGHEPVWAPLFDERRSPPPGISEESWSCAVRVCDGRRRVPMLDVWTLFSAVHGLTGITDQRHGTHILVSPFHQPMAVQLLLNFVLSMV